MLLRGNLDWWLAGFGVCLVTSGLFWLVGCFLFGLFLCCFFHSLEVLESTCWGA